MAVLPLFSKWTWNTVGRSISSTILVGDIIIRLFAHWRCVARIPTWTFSTLPPRACSLQGKMLVWHHPELRCVQLFYFIADLASSRFQTMNGTRAWRNMTKCLSRRSSLRHSLWACTRVSPSDSYWNIGISSHPSCHGCTMFTEWIASNIDTARAKISEVPSWW